MMKIFCYYYLYQYYSLFVLLLFTQSNSRYCNVAAAVAAAAAAWQISLPGGKSISYNQESGALRIQLNKDANNNLQVPPKGTQPLQDIVVNSIEIRNTGIPQKGHGAFATKGIKNSMFLGFYEGDIIQSREKLDDVVRERKLRQKDDDDDDEWNNNNQDIISIGAMDYVMSLDGGVTFIDGFNRANDRTSFSTVHLNHVDKGTSGCNCIRILEDDRVAFFTSRDINIGEELCFDYGSNFWIGREDSKV